MSPTDPLNPNFVYDETDEKVWREELDPFLPSRLFDFHGHVYLAEHKPSMGRGKVNPSSPVVVSAYPHEAFAAVERTLFPGREVRALVFGWTRRSISTPPTPTPATPRVRTGGRR